ncbi:MAG TPA: hypothetical protein VFV38_19120 [Ktedonobacteraceae bacterium]|nr:hypothetical protein [Ktedonobacteraceae bacterium]
MRKANGGTATATATKTVNAEQPQNWHGLYAMTPIALLVMVLICAVALWIFTNLQITGTENSI